jgi:hypothetical protein
MGPSAPTTVTEFTEITGLLTLSICFLIFKGGFFSKAIRGCFSYTIFFLSGILTRHIVWSMRYNVCMTATRIAGGVVHAIPADVRATLLAVPAVLRVWERITPLARNEWICWIISVKKSETRNRHIERMCEDLLNGKHRPCCWAGCIHR